MKDEKWQTWVWIKWKPGTPSNAWETWRNDPQITNAWSTIGEWDCCLATKASSPDELEEFVWKKIRPNQWVESTHSSFVKKWW